MNVLLNGEAMSVPEEVTVIGLLEVLGLAGERVAVEVNRDIVPRADHGARTLAEGDAIELVHFVGGG